ncbi:MAG: 3'-5' exonuclease [Gammaproteobacteria bacterium]
MHCFAFDIETVPDAELGRRLYALDGLSDQDVVEVMVTRRRQESGHEFLPLLHHRVVAISVALRTRDQFRVWSLGDPDAGESEIVGRFFDGLERLSPDLVSWNGKGFDLPVLHYRAMLHGIQAARYWETGDDDQGFRWNNYLNRFHWRHLDLMDVLSGFQSGGRAKLDDCAVLLGFPGKLGMHGSQVREHFARGEIERIRNYCETDVLNTFLIYLRFEHMRGRLGPAELAAEYDIVRAALAADNRPHLNEFLDAWRQVPA